MLKTDFNTFVRLQLYKQKLIGDTPFKGEKGIISLLETFGYIQLDTMNATARTQDIFLWSRVKNYKKDMLLKLYEEEFVFEQYMHALCLLPCSSRSYLLNSHENSKNLLQNDPEIDFILDIYNKACKFDEVSSNDFYKDESNGDVWHITPTRAALDKLWRADLLRVKRNENFKKIYIATKESERELENKSDYMMEYFVDIIFENLGIATYKEVKNYFGFNKKKINEILNYMTKEEKIKKIEINGINDGEEHFIRTEDIKLLDYLKNKKSEARTFLTPFDNMLRDRSRVLKLFNVDYRIESYIPKKQRKYGYFAMPILVGERIIGIIDLKLHRKESILQVNKLTLFYSMEKKIHMKETQNILKSYASFLGADHIKMDENPFISGLEV